MIQYNERAFFLHTAHSTYGFRVTALGHLEHLYYGGRIHLPEPLNLQHVLPLSEKRAFAPGSGISYDQEHKPVALEDTLLEMSSYGKGDIRVPFVEISYADGNFTSDFLFDSAAVTREKPEYDTLPGSYSEDGNVEHLTITMKERHYGVTLELHYYVYPECDVICRSAKLLNSGTDEIQLRRLMSNQVDFHSEKMKFTTFTGGWAREMKRTDVPVAAGKLVNSSYCGVSSAQANPFTMLSGVNTDEDHGDCYGFNLLYSGNHYTAVEVGAFGKLRLVSGINPRSFCFRLAPGEVFEAPEAVMAYSSQGFNGMSQCMHHFVKEHVVRGQWKKKPRPVLLNSWEAAHFDINERKLLELAKAGKEIGVELFVMDDGWFGGRDDDTSSLGDWFVSAKKLPDGLKGLCDKVNALDLQFGLWVEPEMVNVESQLYKAHPDWTMAVPDHGHSEGRNQRVLDLTRKEVCDYIISAMTEVFSSCNLSYVKWDMNRIFSDVYSPVLPPENQGEVFHRYVVGLYRCMKTLTERFPHILFEGCASGGNRFDLGILSYFPQIWSSDNTDAICRAEIQTGYSYGYPISTMGAHVSACPNHQTLRTVPLETRFEVAAFGIFGYECNLSDMSREMLNAMKNQVELYKQWRDVFQFGDFYRLKTVYDGFGNADSALTRSPGGVTEWITVAPDQSRAVGVSIQKLVCPNTSFASFKARGLQPDALYRFYNRPMKVDIRGFGDLLNMFSPIHIKQDGLLHNAIAKVYKMDGEVEDAYLYGDALMNCGIMLHQNFAGTGFNDQVRYYQDFSSRLYFMERKENEI